MAQANFETISKRIFFSKIQDDNLQDFYQIILNHYNIKECPEQAELAKKNKNHLRLVRANFKIKFEESKHNFELF